jgi:hypothetical protein
LTLLVLYIVVAASPRQVRLNVLSYLGLAVTGRRHWLVVYLAGLLVWLALAIVFALLHAGLHQAFEIETDIFVWGVLFGLGQWVIVGAALGWLGRRHPGIRTEAVADPGPFAIDLPVQTVLAFLGLHLLFGTFVAAFYDALR